MVFRAMTTQSSSIVTWFTGSDGHSLNAQLNSSLMVTSGSQATASFADGGEVYLDDINFIIGELYPFRLKHLTVTRGFIYLFY